MYAVGTKYPPKPIFNSLESNLAACKLNLDPTPLPIQHSANEIFFLMCASARAELPRTDVHFNRYFFPRSREQKQNRPTHQAITRFYRAQKNTYFDEVISRYDTEI